MIAIVDSGGANIASVQYALQRLGVEAILTANPSQIMQADKIILPGVGTAKNAMQKLSAHGLIPCLKTLTQPVLGICLGMQLLFKNSEEGHTPLLGHMDQTVQKFAPLPERTVPHMGWNKVQQKNSALFQNIPENSSFYFVHSYYAPVTDFTVGTCCYGQDFSAVIHYKNFFGCQFHPEKSGKIGAQLLQNFLEM